MRRHNVRLGLMILDILMMLPLTGCKFWKVRDTIERTEDGFEYALAKYTNGRVETDPSKGFVTITKLADPDENGRLDIPRTIAGFPVKYLGRSANDMDYAEDRPIYFPGTLKKLFVFETLKGIDNVQNPGKVSFDLMACADKLFPSDIADAGARTFVYKSLYDKTLEFFNSRENPSNYPAYDDIPANITFMNNYPLEDDGGHYRLDNIEGEECIIEPPAPELEGYEFNGWYTDKECKDKWDFATSLTLKMGDEFVHYAGWKTA